MEFSVDEILAELQPMLTDSLNAPGDDGFATVGLLTQNINLQYAMPSQMIDSSSQMDYIVNGHVLPSGPTYASISSFQSSSTLHLPEANHMMEDFRSPNSDYSTVNALAGIQNPSDDDTFFQTSQYHAIREARWMKLFGVLKWFCLIRKRRVRVLQLDKPLTEVQA